MNAHGTDGKNRIWIYVWILSWFVLLFNNGCKKEESTPTEPSVDKIGSFKDLLWLTPEYQPGTYRNMDKIAFTRTIPRGNTVYPLPESTQPLTSVEYTLNGTKTYNIDDFIVRNQVAGLLIIKDGKIVLERYAQGNNAASRWTSYSVAKSITATLIGIALKEGKIKNINDQVTTYLPLMTGTAYDGVTVRQLLQMSSGASWNEDYRDPSSDFRVMFQCAVDGKAGGTMELLSKLSRAGEPGTQFLYNSGETFLEGELLKAALGGESLSSYLSRKIWANMGMESDAYWLLESDNGAEFGCGNVSMTLRDYGRFGMFILNDGVVNGTSMLPEGWTAEAGIPAADSPQLNYGALYLPEGYYYPLGYGYNWWLMPETPWGPWDYLSEPLLWGNDTISAPSTYFPNLEGTFTAQGVFGQFIHINQKERMVTVVWSTWKDPWIDPKEYEVYCFMNAATELLKR